jgi:Zn-dependent protease
VRPLLPRHPRTGGSSLLWRGRLRLVGAHHLDLELHPRWLLTLVAITWLLGQALLPVLFPHWPRAAHWGVAATVALIDCLAGVLHELGHAAAALAKGRRVYRITLYGLAASVRRSNADVRPRDQFAISIAGPISHLLIGSLLWTAWQLAPGDNEPLRAAAAFPAISNLAAGIFNLLPLQPLDGGRAARALVAVVLRV